MTGTTGVIIRRVLRRTRRGRVRDLNRSCAAGAGVTSAPTCAQHTGKATPRRTRATPSGSAAQNDNFFGFGVLK